MKKIQKQVDDWVAQYKIGYFRPLEILARLTEEVGELARELNHRFGPKKKKPSEETLEIGDEIADIIFTLACLSNSLGIDMDKHFHRVMDKYSGRDKDRWEKKQDGK
jgi:NTP pyrophosphatase (non-canonical NTP hydrolase)